MKNVNKYEIYEIALSGPAAGNPFTDVDLRAEFCFINRKRVMSGFYDGGGVYKIRVAKPGKGKSGGYRVFVFFKSKKRTFFVYGFPKARMDNITESQLKDLKRTAKALFSLTESQLNEVLKTGKYVEI